MFLARASVFVACRYLIRPHWQLLAAPEVVLPFQAKADKAFWRGGVGKGDELRSALVHCAE
jgi:hypothetical protein